MFILRKVWKILVSQIPHSNLKDQWQNLFFKVREEESFSVLSLSNILITWNDSHHRVEISYIHTFPGHLQNYNIISRDKIYFQKLWVSLRYSKISLGPAIRPLPLPFVEHCKTFFSGTKWPKSMKNKGNKIIKIKFFES